MIVVCPATYEPERRYAVGVVLEELLGLEHQVEFREGVRGHVDITAERRVLRVPDVLFDTSPDRWLTPASVPQPPFRNYSAGGAGGGLPLVLSPEPAGEDPRVPRVPVDVFGLAFF